jgi:hypothetical protein
MKLERLSVRAYLGDGMGRGLSSARSELRDESGPRPLEALKIKQSYA